MDPPTSNKAASSADSHTASTPDAQDQKRRSSSRSIKRKRFDDEIVEYSLGLPPAQVHRLGGRARTQSQTYVLAATAPSVASAATSTPTSSSNVTAAVSDSISISSPAPTPTTTAPLSPQPTAASIALKAIVTSATSSGGTQPRVTATFAPNSAISAASTTTAGPAAAADAAATVLLPTPTSSLTSSSSIAINISTSVSQSATMSALPEKRRAPKSAITSAASGISVTYAAGAAVTSAATATLTGAGGIANIAPGPSASKKAKKSRIGQQISTKDLGRWKPIDDLALILGVQQTNDLRMVHRGIKFSCKFTVQELQSRWYSLMYEETISRLAVAAMRNLHPELVEAVQAKALYTTQEEELLGGIKSTESPTLETFQELLDKNALVFFSARTAKALSTHWQLMKQYALLPDQQSQLTAQAAAPSALGSGATGDGKLMTFAEAEEQLNDTELLGEPRDETVELELTLADRCNKKEIRMLENELTRWTVLVDSLTGIGFMPEFDNQTLAVLRGRLVRYLMRSREISFGRTTKDQAVDVDLSLEGPAHKASRRQGTIKLRSNGDFFIVNEGKRPLFIDGAPLLQGNKGRLSNNTIIEMAGLRFIFLINSDLINAIRQESAKMSGPLS